MKGPTLYHRRFPVPRITIVKGRGCNSWFVDLPDGRWTATNTHPEAIAWADKHARSAS